MVAESPRRGNRGFTLMEAVVAMFLSSILVGLVTSVFMAQNRLYENILTRSEVQEAARVVVDVIASEFRSATRGSVRVAESRQVVVRTAQVLGSVCSVTGASAYAYMGLDGSKVDSLEISGYGIREADGTWNYHTSTWSSLFGASGSTPKSQCATAGADTTGAPPPTSGGWAESEARRRRRLPAPSSWCTGTWSSRFRRRS